MNACIMQSIQLIMVSRSINMYRWKGFIMKNLTDTVTLSNGIKMPCIGFGTWQTPDSLTGIRAVETALKVGYRHIDTAAAYKNEESVGKAIKNSGRGRSKIFVTSKVWNSARGYDKATEAFKQSLKALELEYLDLYLIHWPAVKKHYEDWEHINQETWRAMVDLYKHGKIRAIGVSNFLPHHLEGLMSVEVKPMVNQIEIHPGQMQKEVVNYCRRHNIVVEAWSPLGTGRMLENSLLLEIARSYHKSVAQLCIKWCMQNGAVPLPKSVHPTRIEENAKVFDFTISPEDMEQINALAYFGGSGHKPDEVNF